MTRIIHFSAICSVLLALVSCAGYKLGGIKPTPLRSVHTVAVPMMRNATQHPRASVIATSALTNALVQDGTYRLSASEKADAILEAELSRVDYRAIRTSYLDSMLPEELANTVTVSWILRDARDPTKILMSGFNNGTSQLYVTSNLQTARNNALPEALDRASEAIVSRIANGY